MAGALQCQRKDENSTQLQPEGGLLEAIPQDKEEMARPKISGSSWSDRVWMAISLGSSLGDQDPRDSSLPAQASVPSVARLAALWTSMS